MTVANDLGTSPCDVSADTDLREAMYYAASDARCSDPNAQPVWRYLRVMAAEIERLSSDRHSQSRPQDTWLGGSPMPQHAVLGLGPGGWADLIEAERDGASRCRSDRTHVSIRWGTLRVLMHVLRAIRLEDFRK